MAVQAICTQVQLMECQALLAGVGAGVLPSGVSRFIQPRSAGRCRGRCDGKSDERYGGKWYGGCLGGLEWNSGWNVAVVEGL